LTIVEGKKGRGSDCLPNSSGGRGVPNFSSPGSNMLKKIVVVFQRVSLHTGAVTNYALKEHEMYRPAKGGKVNRDSIDLAPWAGGYGSSYLGGARSKQ